MAFSNGVFSRIYSWVNDKNANIDITASRFDTEDDGFATGLSTCILKDGTQTLTASIPFGGFKITGYGTSAAPSARSDVPSLGQVEDGTVNWVAAAGSADVITAGYTPALTALVDGQLCFFRATAANATTTPTFSPNGLTARTITKRGGAALIAGDIPAANAEVILRYNLANTRWELLNPAGGAVDPTTWTPVDSSGASLSLTVNDAYYTKIGKMVTLIFSITFPVTANGSTAKIGGLPANPKALAGTDQIFTITSANSQIVARLDNTGSAATMTFAGSTTTATPVANSNFSAATITGTFTYIAV